MTGSESSGEGSSIPTIGDGDSVGGSDSGRALQRGDVLGRYLVTAALGHGGMGVVYAAYDPELDRRVAIKVLHPHARGSLGSSSGQERMLREGRAMARLSHPNVVTVHDVGAFERSVFVAMEYIDGVTLAQWLASAQRRWSEVLAVFLQAGEGLAAAHGVGLIHRDFKPDNVMIPGHGRVVVMDFGLARSAADADEQVTGPMPVAGVESRLTQSGAMLGTPAYMAPEQHMSRKTTAQTDQFSFCVALHEALWGMRPFAGDTVPALAVAVTTGHRVDPADLCGVPVRIHRAITRGLALDPADRWPSMRALIDELGREPARRQRRVLTIVAVPVLAIAGAIALDRLGDARSESVCGGGESQVAAIWHDERRGVIASAFAATGLGHADDTRARIEHELDGYVIIWSAQYREACEATNVAQVQSADLMDRRMSCLRRRLQDVDALLGQLEQATDALVDRAVPTVARATDLSACSDVDALLAGVELPQDTATRDHIEALEPELATARAQRTAGRTADALATLDAVLVRLDELDWPPLRAEVLFMRAQTLGELGDPQGSERTMTEAYWSARKSGTDRIAAQTAAELMVMVAESRPEQVELWEQQARADVERLGDDGELHARLLDDLAMIATNARDLDRAEALHHEALVIWEGLRGPDSLDVAVVEHGLGNIAFLRHADEAATRHYQHAMAIWRVELGEDHPQLADGHVMLGNLAHRSSRLEDAEAEFSAAVGVLERAYGETHIGLGGALNGLALVHADRGHHELALATQERALAITLPSLGESHPQIAIFMGNAGDELAALGRTDEALDRHRRALAIRERTLGHDHPVTSESLDDVGRDLVALGRSAEALPLFERALEIVVSHDGPPEFVERLRTSLAQARQAAGRRPRPR